MSDKGQTDGRSLYDHLGRLPDHWMTAELRAAPGAFQRAAREYAEEYARAYAAQQAASEREPCTKLWVGPCAQVPVHPREGRLANVRPVGAETPVPSYPLDDLYDRAALDADVAAERERLRMIADEIAKSWPEGQQTASMIREGVTALSSHVIADVAATRAAERDRCAVLAETSHPHDWAFIGSAIRNSGPNAKLNGPQGPARKDDK